MKKNIDLLIGFILILYVIVINFTFGRITFSEVFLFGGIVLIIYHFIKVKIRNKNLFNLFKFIVSIGLVIFIVVQIAIIIFPNI